MIKYVSGDLLLSSAQAIVNTVNCEGYMGKGIAYQFKLKYPKNNESYAKACKSGVLKIGTLHCFEEDNKIIINFPTKDKWRKKSKMEYIESGLDALISIIHEKNIKSIAIPPLGSGNGGLLWTDVKALIEFKLKSLYEVNILIYEPSRSYSTTPTIEPQLSVSALILMLMKKHLKKFNTLRLQKVAYFTNISLEEPYFSFKKHKYGPYDNSIAIASKKIKEFQMFHKTKNTDEAYNILLKKIISDSIESRIENMYPCIIKACQFVNTIHEDKTLECCSTILFLLEGKQLSMEEIFKGFQEWSKDKAEKFSENDIENCINILISSGILLKGLIGYSVSKQ